EVLDDIALRFAERAAKQGVALHCEAGAPALAAVDIELFERAVANLVDNALKFTPGGGRITLAAAQQGGEVQVTVIDSGAGIAATDLEHLFARLYQGRERTAPATGEGGKGLGLAIVRRIAELHQGRLEVTSRVGDGTRVLLALPAAA
ncbi:MAG: ATP-binding protein, partial [Rubrivivax sp.]|nr:ATP-binding protein [Rubrivivax sp.]